MNNQRLYFIYYNACIYNGNYALILKSLAGDNTQQGQRDFFFSIPTRASGSISKRLSAPTLGAITLDNSIRELIESINLTNRINIEYTLTGLENHVIRQDLHLAIYRIIQEQLNNILKHAEATTANIHMHYGNGYLSLTISDNGKGFDSKKKRKGIGITNMYSRAEHMGGSMKIISSHTNGTNLQARFPLELE